MDDWIDRDLFRWWMNILIASPGMIIVYVLLDLWVSR